ncbi:virulence factor-like MviN [Actinobacillus pleuropneumoniae]|nr:virulence factor-like MviN [Actinobacillus pleuropneumoniae]
MSKKLLKSGMIVSSMTLISRVLGLVRDVVIAGLLGAGANVGTSFCLPTVFRIFYAASLRKALFQRRSYRVLAEYNADNDLDKTP